MTITPDGNVSGTYKPCPECHRPSAVVKDGEIQPAEGGTTLEWSGLDRAELWVTPHNEGCSEAARPNDPTGKRATFPAGTITNQSFEFDGVRFPGDFR
jgi:hypothetical protein